MRSTFGNLAEWVAYTKSDIRLVLNGQNIGTSEIEEYRTNKYRRVSDPFGRLLFGYFLFPPKICKPRVMKLASITEAQLIFFKKKVTPAESEKKRQ